MSAPVVTVIDIGSNSIKVLVATRENGRVIALKTRTIDARISRGISQIPPRLTDEGMAAGLKAIQELLVTAEPYTPTKTVLVATSAVRDAVNGNDFRRQVLASTGHDIRILNGDEEANLIGLGLTCDPALSGLSDFLVFDLGGGSLECLRFEQGRIAQALSLQLGCVRLTEGFIQDPAAPLDQDEAISLARHVRDTIKNAGFRVPLTLADAVFTGGSMTSVRAIKGALHGMKMEETPAIVATATLADLLNEIAPMTLDERRAMPGMPSSRADVFPVALVTMMAVAEYTGVERFHHSLHNLRWGLAAETLG